MNHKSPLSPSFHSPVIFPLSPSFSLHPSYQLFQAVQIVLHAVRALEQEHHITCRLAFYCAAVNPFEETNKGERSIEERGKGVGKG